MIIQIPLDSISNDVILSNNAKNRNCCGPSPRGENKRAEETGNERGAPKTKKHGILCRILPQPGPCEVDHRSSDVRADTTKPENKKQPRTRAQQTVRGVIRQSVLGLRRKSVRTPCLPGSMPWCKSVRHGVPRNYSGIGIHLRLSGTSIARKADTISESLKS